MPPVRVEPVKFERAHLKRENANMNKEEVLEYMEECHEDVIESIIVEIKNSAKIGKGSVDIYLDTQVSSVTKENHYYVSHRLSVMGYNVNIDHHLDKLTISWF